METGTAVRRALLERPKRFWLRVWPRGDCWEWRGRFSRNGYGITTRGANEHIVAHREAYTQAKGPIPPGLTIDHLCRHRWCVKPSHLEAVSNKTNVLRGDGWGATNAKKTLCPAGHPYGPPVNGVRVCRICRIESNRKYRRLRKPHLAAKPHCGCGRAYDRVSATGHRLCSVCLNRAADKARDTRYGRIDTDDCADADPPSWSPQI